MTDHFITVVSDEDGELSFGFECTAAKGDSCHQQWKDDIPESEVVDTDDCWAAEWVSACGFDEAVRCDAKGVVARIPVDIWCDEGVSVVPIPDANRAALDAVLKLHQSVAAVNYGPREPVLTHVCSGCGTDDGNWVIYPCPTVRAISEALGVRP